MSDFKVGDAVCVIPDRGRISFDRESFEGRKFYVLDANKEEARVGLESEKTWCWFDLDQIIHWDAATPAQRAGLCVGDRIRSNRDQSFGGGYRVGDALVLAEDDGDTSPVFFNKALNKSCCFTLKGFERLLDEPEEEGEELSPEEEATDWMNSQMYDRDCRLPSTREQAFADKLEAKQQLEINEALIEQSRIQKRNSAVITAMSANNQPVSKNGK